MVKIFYTDNDIVGGNLMWLPFIIVKNSTMKFKQDTNIILYLSKQMIIKKIFSHGF